MTNKYWNSFYRKFDVNNPSNFAKFCVKKINKNDFVRVFGDELIKFSVKEKSNFFIVSSPINTSYKTYI